MQKDLIYLEDSSDAMKITSTREWHNSRCHEIL